MKVILGDRRVGKTTKLIELADNYNGYIVVHSVKNAQQVFNMAREMGKKINMPITFYEFMHHQYGYRCRHFYIDDIDLCLGQLSQFEIKAVTLTTGELIDVNKDS